MKARVAGHNELVDAIRAFVGEESGDPAAHGCAHDVAALQPERVLEFTDLLHHVGERVDICARLSWRPPYEVRDEGTISPVQALEHRTEIISPACHSCPV